MYLTMYRYFTGTIFLLFFFYICTQSSFAQDNQSETNATISLISGRVNTDTIPAAASQVYDDEDSTAQPVQAKLLPDNLSFIERSFWGEHGLFRSTGLAPLTPESRKAELGLRRTMLTAHQIGGFVTLAAMLTTCYYGQRVIDGRRDLGDTKSTLAGITVLSYSVTGLLALLSPPPMLRRDEQSTTNTHKLLAWAHVAGMILTPILANNIHERAPGTHKQIWNMDKAHFHQVSGYITTALFTAAMLTVTF